MKNGSRKLTWVECLWVIAVIAFLAAGLLPMLSGGGPSRGNMARSETHDLVSAIEAYYKVYGHMPVSAAVRQAAGAGDFTYGSIINSPAVPTPVGTLPGGQVVLNSEVVAILMDFTNFPGNPGQSTINTNDCLNPQHILFLKAQLVSSAVLPRVGPDLVYRDPWGTPYFITMDLNGDGRCVDAFYGKRAVSQRNATGAAGYNGLTNSVDAGGNGDHFLYQGRVMVWSAGPDQKINTETAADAGENKDNIVSWR
jgi:hypothetical protein